MCRFLPGQARWGGPEMGAEKRGCWRRWGAGPLTRDPRGQTRIGIQKAEPLLLHHQRAHEAPSSHEGPSLLQPTLEALSSHVVEPSAPHTTNRSKPPDWQMWARNEE